MIAIDARHPFALEHGEELVVVELEERIAFAFVEFLQTEDILVKRDRLLDVADFDRDVVAAINLHAHWLVWLVADAATCFARVTISLPSARPSMKRGGMLLSPACAPTSAPARQAR